MLGPKERRIGLNTAKERVQIVFAFGSAVTINSTGDG
jgi:hypothetical protein